MRDLSVVRPILSGSACIPRKAGTRKPNASCRAAVHGQNAGVTFFESMLVLLAVAILLLQVSRRLAIPYPTMLAAAGVGLALIPGAPKIGLDPQTALALFIAPALLDSAFDFPVGQVWRLWRPLFALAVIVVALSAAAVAWLGVTFAGLPLYAAIALGAIVAPPDAAAATAILSNVRMPRQAVAVLKGESLLNDASALLLFGAAISGTKPWRSRLGNRAQARPRGAGWAAVRHRRRTALPADRTVRLGHAWRQICLNSSAAAASGSSPSGWACRRSCVWSRSR